VKPIPSGHEVQTIVVGDFPCDVLFHQDYSGEAEQAAGLGNTPNTSVRRLISLLTRSRALDPPLASNERRERQEVNTGVVERRRNLRAGSFHLS